MFPEHYATLSRQHHELLILCFCVALLYVITVSYEDLLSHVSYSLWFVVVATGFLLLMVGLACRF